MKVYLVGGAVRDSLLGLPFHERDWVVVGATKEELIKEGYKQIGKDFPVFLHPETKEEYALARKEKKTGAGHKAFSFEFDRSVSLEEDLERRDITINAIAQDKEGNFIDPYNRLQDIEDKIIRKVSSAFKEDPLRVLRVARFAAKLNRHGFSIDEDTMIEIQKIVSSGELTTLTKERIWMETQKALETDSPEVFFELIQECGALNQICPLAEIHKAVITQAYKYNETTHKFHPPEIWLMQLSRLFSIMNNLHVEFLSILNLSFWLIPTLLNVTLPFIIILGLVLDFIKFHRDNEIIAIFSLGLTLKEIRKPIILLSLLMIIFYFLLNFIFSPLTYGIYKENEFKLRNSIDFNKINISNFIELDNKLILDFKKITRNLKTF